MMCQENRPRDMEPVVIFSVQYGIILNLPGCSRYFLDKRQTENQDGL